MSGALAFVGYILIIPAANWAITSIGMVPVGFGYLAPAGVYFAGLAFGLRDVLQEKLGNWATVIAIAIGALLSLAVADVFVASASALAFLFSELADMAVYTPLRRRSWLAAVALSNTVGLTVDSALFLAVAFGSLDFLSGQIIGKLAVTIVTVGLFGLARAYLAPRDEDSDGSLLAGHSHAELAGDD